jgi:hypothetical protein
MSKGQDCDYDNWNIAALNDFCNWNISFDSTTVQIFIICNFTTKRAAFKRKPTYGFSTRDILFYMSLLVVHV